MKLSDFKVLFKEQLDTLLETDSAIFFMLVDENKVVVKLHQANDFKGLMKTLDGFQYIGSDKDIPKFSKIKKQSIKLDKADVEYFRQKYNRAVTLNLPAAKKYLRQLKTAEVALKNNSEITLEGK